MPRDGLSDTQQDKGSKPLRHDTSVVTVTKPRNHETRKHETTKARKHETTKARNHESTKPYLCRVFAFSWLVACLVDGQIHRARLVLQLAPTHQKLDQRRAALTDRRHELRGRRHVCALQQIHQRAEAGADVRERIGRVRSTSASTESAAALSFERGEFVIERFQTLG